MSYDLSTKEFTEAAAPEIVTRECSRGLSITVQAENKETAACVLWDIQTALEHGAVPAAHAVMITHLNDASKSKKPLAMRLAL